MSSNSKNILLATILVGAFCAISVFLSLGSEAIAQMRQDSSGRWVNSAGGNIYGDSRFNLDADPRFNLDADPRFNLDADPRFNLEGDPRYRRDK